MAGAATGSQAIERALDLLSAFGPDTTRLSLSELAEHANIPPSTARRLLKALLAKGFIEQEPLSRQYQLGMQLTRLGHIAETQSDLHRLASDPMAKLVEQLGESAYLARLAGSEVIYLMVMRSKQWVQITAEVGQAYPAWATASGRVLLAELSDDEVRALVPEPIAPFLGRYTITMDGLLAELQRIREQGYSQHAHDKMDDVSSIAAPIFGGDGKANVALTVSGPSFRFNETVAKEAIELIKRTAAEISFRIGGHPRQSRYGTPPRH
jgi:DNA-binding IclR family transcriptional regulator